MSSKMFSKFFFICVIISCFSPTFSDIDGEKSCREKCDSSVQKEKYEECVQSCMAKTRSLTTTEAVVTTAEWPTPPKSINVKWSVEKDVLVDEKYLRANVSWEADDDPIREGFYLTVASIPVGEECKKFSSYSMESIPRDATYWEIPTSYNGHALQIEYGCEYKFRLLSTPYPFPEDEHLLIETFRVPECVEKICSCESQEELPAPTNLTVDSRGSQAFLRWNYPWEDVSEDQLVQFHLKLADPMKSSPSFRANSRELASTKTKLADPKPSISTILKIYNLYKYRDWRGIVDANPDDLYYEAELPNLKDGQRFKVHVFAMNEHWCKSDPSEKEFTFSTSQTVSTSQTATPAPENPNTESDGPTVTAQVAPTENPFFNRTEKLDEPQNSTLFIFNNTNVTTATFTTTEETVEIPKTPSTYSRDEYFLMVFLPIIIILCLIITAFAVCKFYGARRQQLLKKQQYFERISGLPWTVLTHPSTSPSMETNILYTEKEIIDARARGLADEFEISYDRLVLGRVIGQGAFGLVYMGTALALNGVSGLTNVAIKQLKANAEERERLEFLEEIDIMKKVGHHTNIVTMYGCCTLQYPHCMVMEYVPYGDLLHYLRNLRKEYEKQMEEYRISVERDYIMHLNTHPLMTYAEINAALRSLRSISIAESIRNANFVSNNSVSSHGTAYYCNKSIVDETGENADQDPNLIPFVDDDTVSEVFTPPIPVSNEVPPLTYTLDPAELQSFAYQVACGMSHLEQLKITHRDLAARNILVGHGKALKISDFGLSRMGIYVKTTSGRIPLRWLSIEAMRDHTYSTKSDVWAYGTLLWEICTLGGFPYPTVADKDLLRYVESGKRLEKPVSCSDAIYRLMLQCWSHLPAHRPSFAHIKRTLNEMNTDGSPYVEFNPDGTGGEPSVLPPQEYCRISPLAPPNTARALSITDSERYGRLT